MRNVALSSLLLLAACGSESIPDVEMLIPFSAAGTVSCTQISELSAMNPVLRIGGHMPCPLTLNTDLSASGSCPQITIGIVRPMMVVYTLVSSDTTTSAQVAYHVGSVDLRKDSLPEDLTAPLPIMLVDDDINGAVITQEGQIDTLLGMATTLGMSENLQNALNWTKEQNDLNDDSLDLDTDACENITEVCARGASNGIDGLFDPGNPNDVCP